MLRPVNFRGPILFIDTDGSPNEALIPDSERVLTSDNGTPNAHPDGAETKAHFAGLLTVDSAGATHYMSLRDRVVTLDDRTGGATTKGDGYSDIVPVDEVANAGMAEPMELITRAANDYATRVTTEIAFKGGSIGAVQPSIATFWVESQVQAFSAARPLPLIPQWTPGSKKASVVITDRDGNLVETIPLRDDVEIFIYNWHPERPSVTSMSISPPCVPDEDVIEDIDFRWAYELFLPPAESYTKWRGGGSLPVPLTKCAAITSASPIDPPGPDSSGCVSFRATRGGT